MNRQEGYIELDGTVVSIAAKKAHAVAEKHDAEINERIKKQQEEDQKREQYLLSDAAVEDVKAVREKAVKTGTVTRTKRGLFFDHTFEETVTYVDMLVLYELLEQRNPYWSGFRLNKDAFYNEKSLVDMSDGEIKHKIYYNHIRDSAYSWCFSGVSNTAYYYKQFFDLKGKVLLTLEQYSKLKEYM